MAAEDEAMPPSASSSELSRLFSSSFTMAGSFLSAACSFTLCAFAASDIAFKLREAPSMLLKILGIMERNSGAIFGEDEFDDDEAAASD